jgi:uncharacterized membrane protein YgcG
MNLLRLLRLSCPALVLASAGALSCSSVKDTEATVPSQRGAVQPDGGGALVTEADACDKLTKAEKQARAALSCPAVTRECPGYIRPAGNDACYLYDQASIDGCTTLFRQFTSCEDFALHPCLISASSLCDTGEGGAGGAPSSPGEGGNAGSAGESGGGGSAGSPVGSGGAAGTAAGAGGA